MHGRKLILNVHTGVQWRLWGFCEGIKCCFDAKSPTKTFPLPLAGHWHRLRLRHTSVQFGRSSHIALRGAIVNVTLLIVHSGLVCTVMAHTRTHTHTHTHTHTDAHTHKHTHTHAYTQLNHFASRIFSSYVCVTRGTPHQGSRPCHVSAFDVEDGRGVYGIRRVLVNIPV